MVKSRKDLRKQRKVHLRKKLSGNAEKLRIFVFRSNRYMTIGAADDDAGKVLFSEKAGKNVKECAALGKKFAKKMVDKGYKEACFDRSGYRFNARLASIVNAMRESGISI